MSRIIKNTEGAIYSYLQKYYPEYLRVLDFQDIKQELYLTTERDINKLCNHFVRKYANSTSKHSGGDNKKITLYKHTHEYRAYMLLVEKFKVLKQTLSLNQVCEQLSINKTRGLTKLIYDKKILKST